MPGFSVANRLSVVNRFIDCFLGILYSRSCFYLLQLISVLSIFKICFKKNYKMCNLYFTVLKWFEMV